MVQTGIPLHSFRRQRTPFSNATMPRVAEIKSLVKLCTDCIIKAIDNSSRNPTVPLAIKQYGDEGNINSKLICNPFHQLPVALLEKVIWSITSSRKLINAKILGDLIIPQIQHLFFSFYSDDYLSFFPILENLLTLDFGNTRVGNSCLKSIGTYCSQLRSFSLKHCSSVTDTGIEWLCGVDNMEIGNGKSGLCKTIQTLDILYTRVTKQGVIVALNNLLFLKILKNYHTIEALVELAQSAANSNRPGFYSNMFSVSTLYVPPDKPYRSNSLQVALSLCHSLNHVSIYVSKELKDSDLLCLMSLSVLRKLEICRSQLWVLKKSEITFDGGVAPLLKVFGRSLKDLVLECVKSVRISIVIEFCPNLIALYISSVLGSVKNEKDLFQVEKKPPILKELKVLYCVFHISADILAHLLSSPSLQHIGISHCNALTDEVFLEAVQCHRFKNLKKLEIASCDSVTGRCIDMLLLLKGPNPLETINLFWCRKLAFKYLEDWLSLIAKKNWNLNISVK